MGSERLVRRVYIVEMEVQEEGIQEKMKHYVAKFVLCTQYSRDKFMHKYEILSFWLID